MQCCFQLLLEFTRSWNVFEQYCSWCDLNVLIHWLSFFKIYCPPFTDSSFNHLSLPPSWYEYCLFSFLGSTVLPQGVSTFQGVLRRVDVISVEDFADSIDVLLCSTIFLVLESNFLFQRSCIFKSNFWNEIREVSVLEKDILKIKLFGQRPNTCNSMQSFDCLVFWKQKSTRCKIKMAFPMVLCVHFKLWFWVYLFDGLWWGEIFVNFKNKILRLYQERLFLFLAFILSTCTITSSLIHEVKTLIEKLFQFWECHLLVQIAYLIEKDF